MKLLRLSGRKVCERVKTKGILWRGTHMHARVLTGLPRSIPADSPIGLYTGMLTSAKLDASAVKRNRMRRRCREALRLTLKSDEEKAVGKLPLVIPIQLILLPRSSSLSVPFGELLADVERLLKFLTTLRAPSPR